MKSTLIALAALTLCGSAAAQTVLNANPAPANNGGSSGWALFMDFTAPGGAVTITDLETANSAAAGTAFTVEVLTYVGSCLGGPASSGPGSSMAGWTSLGIANATQGAAGSTGLSDPIDIPDIVVPAGQTVGVALLFNGSGPRYKTGTLGGYNTFADANLSWDTGDSRSAPFTTGGSFFSPREFVGSVTYVGGGGATTYCTAKTNSLGCVPAISGNGTPSASATSGFTVDCGMVRNNKSGLLFYTVNGAQNSGAFQCGTLCVGPSGIKRTPAQSAGGNPAPANDCSGNYSLDMNAFGAGLAGGNPEPALGVAGTQVNAQYWGRDQGFASPCNTMLSDGVEYTIGS